MSSEWPIVQVDQACKLIVDCVNKTAPVVSEKTPYRMIRTTNIRNGRVNLEECRYVDEITFEKWTRRAKLQYGDVVLTREAPIGEAGFITEPENLFLGQRVMQYQANPAILAPRFLLYAFRSPFLQHQFGSHEGSGSVISHIRVGDCYKFKIPLPPLPVQTEIAETLGAIDDRIALLRETNATLEAIAQALFKSWFVDFDPVHANAALLPSPCGRGAGGEGRQSTSPHPNPLPLGEGAVLPPEIAALFPDSFEESELGLVPREWIITNVHEVAEVVKGKSYTSKELVDEHHTALVTLKSFERGGGFRLNGFKPYTGSYKPNQVVKSGDLIVAYTDVTQAAELIGKPAIVVGVSEYQTLVASLDVGIIRPNEKSDKQFLYGLFRTESFQSHTFSHTSGTTVLHLSKAGIGSFQFACPPIQVIRAFSQIAEAISSKRQNNIDQIRILTTLRDTLLPRLISGQLRLPDAEAMLEETT